MKSKNDLNLTSEQEGAFEELRRRILKDLPKCIYDENHFIYRFLKARDFKVDQAETMLRNHLAWRRKYNVDTILKDYKPPEILQKHFLNRMIGYDNEGCPVFYAPCGKLDIPGLLLSAKESDINKTIIYFFEQVEKVLEEQSKKLNKRVTCCTYIDDVENLSFANSTNKRAGEVIVRVIQNQQLHYPERVKAVYIINASNLFTVPFSILKGFIESSTLKKVNMFGSVGWKPELLKFMDADRLPAFLGGEMTDPDGNPLCTSLIDYGGKVDEKYYVRKGKKSLAGKEGVKKLILSRSSFSEIVLEVEEDGSVIEWEFETKNRDIGFGLFYQEIVDGEEKITEIVSLQRLDTEEFPETGIYKCERAGTYIMLFDNSYSWIRSKEIYYKAKVVCPKDHEAEVRELKQKNI